MGVVDVPYRGRMLKIAGDRTFEPWTVTVLNDQSFKFRAFFEAWSSNIQALQQNYQNANTIADYQAMAKVRQMDRKGSIIRTYKFEGIWPLTSVRLNWIGATTILLKSTPLSSKFNTGPTITTSTRAIILGLPNSDK